MNRLISGTIVGLLLAGCQHWPQEGEGGMAEQSLPWDGYLQSPLQLQEHQAQRQRVVAAQHSLELLKLRGSMACMPERTYQVEQLLGLVRKELAAGLTLDANEHLLLLDNQLFRLSVRLTEMQRRMGCGHGIVQEDNRWLHYLLEPEQFAFDRYELLPVFDQRLQQLAPRLIAAPELRLTVIGYADPQGESGYNQQLGQQRADAVVVRLQQLGVPAQQLQAQSAGERFPEHHPEHRTAMLASRKVEFQLGVMAAPGEPLPLSQWPRLDWSR